MLDMNMPLGRKVPTADQVLTVIAPQMRMIRACHQGVVEAMARGDIQHARLERGPLSIPDGGDNSAYNAVTSALHTSALRSVSEWARRENLVYDGVQLENFITDALVAAMDDGKLPEGALAY